MSRTKWQCQYIDTYGKRCERAALYRLQFSLDHPFDHTDFCEVHKEEHKFYLWFELIDGWPEAT